MQYQVEAIQAEVTKQQQETEADLAKAEPALQAANAALNTLNRVCMCVCVLHVCTCTKQSMCSVYCIEPFSRSETKCFFLCAELFYFFQSNSVFMCVCVCVCVCVCSWI